MPVKSPLKVAIEKAEEYDKQLKANDFNPNTIVLVTHEDGTSFIFYSAFLLEIDKVYIAVFTEHHNFHVFNVEDLIRLGQYKLDDSEKPFPENDKKPSAKKGK